MENTPIDTSTELLGRKLAFPLLTAPIGSLKLQFNPTDDIGDFNEKCMAPVRAGVFSMLSATA